MPYRMPMLQGEPASILFDPRIFRFLLHKELARAERYNYFVSILLFKPEGIEKSKQGSSIHQLAQVLASDLRKSDYLGSIEEGILGIILLHASIESARIVLERLRSEAFFWFCTRPQEVDLKASYAVYPSEANSLEFLCELAIQRLT